MSIKKLLKISSRHTCYVCAKRGVFFMNLHTSQKDLSAKEITSNRTYVSSSPTVYNFKGRIIPNSDTMARGAVQSILYRPN